MLLFCFLTIILCYHDWWFSDFARNCFPNLLLEPKQSVSSPFYILTVNFGQLIFRVVSILFAVYIKTRILFILILSVKIKCNTKLPFLIWLFKKKTCNNSMNRNALIFPFNLKGQTQSDEALIPIHKYFHPVTLVAFHLHLIRLDNGTQLYTSTSSLWHLDKH